MTLADQARKIPVLAAAESALTGMLTTEHDLPIADYDKHTADDIVAKLTTVSQRELRKIGAYEAKHDNRVTILDRIAALTAVEPWTGYDEQNVGDITAALADHDAQTARDVGVYEEGHKNRAGIRDAVERQTAGK
ncbi:MAG: hypothetical protein ABSH51_22505 [Solirubrobacteraceae bacterium]|jgi:hypothetical protein